MSTLIHPLVSIGVPLYNEERFIALTLQNLIDQEYLHIEILISDNASTDNTLTICRQLVGERENVFIHSFVENQGAAENFRYVLTRAKGKYFMWASGHDLWSSNFISENVRLLESTPDAVISSGSSTWIGEDGKELDKKFGYYDTQGMNVVGRYFTVFWGNMNPILGLIRKSALDRAKTIQSMVGADLILLTELVLQGDFIHASNTHWQRREFRHEGSHAQKLKRYRSAEYRLTRSMWDRYFPLGRLPYELIRNILTSDLKKREKTAALIALIACMPARYLAAKQ